MIIESFQGTQQGEYEARKSPNIDRDLYNPYTYNVLELRKERAGTHIVLAINNHTAIAG